MTFHENKTQQSQVIVENTSGTAYVQGELVLEQGFFGNVTNPEGIADGAKGTIDINTERSIETDQINTSDTFAVSTGQTPAIVWFKPSTGLLEDATATDNVQVGLLVDGGVKDSNNVIRFMPFGDRLTIDA